MVIGYKMRVIRVIWGFFVVLYIFVLLDEFINFVFVYSIIFICFELFFLVDENCTIGGLSWR